jgi:L-fuculose-phosphate aldolase
MNKAELAIRKGIIDACLSMNRLGINQGTSGNISARFEDRMLVTPTGVPYDDLSPEDIMATPISGDGSEWKGPLAPSSEWRFHLSILQKRPEIGGIVHTHSMYATVLAICHKPIPAVHYMVAAAGGPDIKVARYATFGTEELSNYALEAMEGRNACLLGNHGVIAAGSNVKRALWLAVEVETLARQYYLSMAIEGARILPDDEIARVKEKMKRGYGHGTKAAAAAAKTAKKPQRKPSGKKRA